MEKYFKVNQSLWDQKTQVHVESEFYDNESFLKGRNTLNPIELEVLGDVKGKRILHLQCHFGQDSLSLARMGAEVTALDFSSAAIQKAREFNTQLGLDVRFVEGNVYDTRKLIPETFDMVFCSYGIIPWLPDLKPWSKVIVDSLEPGGIFLYADFHPTFYLFEFETKQVEYNYFNSGKPYLETMEGTYADPDADMSHDEYFWNHSLVRGDPTFFKARDAITGFRGI